MADVEYFARRCIEERSAALTAVDPRVALLHEDMAVLYEAAAKVTEQPRRSIASVFPMAELSA
jgi:hypothetical protein